MQLSDNMKKKKEKPSGEMETSPGASISGRYRWLQVKQALID